MQIKMLLQQAIQQLSAYSASAQLDAEILLAHSLSVSRSYLVGFSEREIAHDVCEWYQQLIQRRQAGEPVAYLTGKKEFWSLELTITPAVLIPRPETELMVEIVLQRLKKNQKYQVADLGTGSGAIALALAKECPMWDIYATDISDAALHVAQANAHLLQLSHIHFKQGNWCDALPAMKFAAIISNPPYIAADDQHLADLGFEPHTALVACNDGFAALTTIISQAKHYLLSGGILVLEHGYRQGTNVAQCLVAAGYTQVKLYQDLAGNDRITIASWQ